MHEQDSVSAPGESPRDATKYESVAKRSQQAYSSAGNPIWKIKRPNGHEFDKATNREKEKER